MKFGISTFVTDEGIAPGALATAIEERGFDSLFVAEHTHIPLSRKSPWPRGGELPRRYYRTLDPFITLTAAAAASGALLGTSVLAARFPRLVAWPLATLGGLYGGLGVVRAARSALSERTTPRYRDRAEPSGEPFGSGSS
jgi:alkanesulfonate monooxygenase SsuD/methylene tetrahydromethanopterin reductase-like flavin-dependent oxidoreductase (luciferase family)